MSCEEPLNPLSVSNHPVSLQPDLEHGLTRTSQDQPVQWQKEGRVVEILSSLSYRTGELKGYLQKIAQGINELIGLDWSVVTLCRNGFERVLASTIDPDKVVDQSYSLHGTLTETVIERGCSLIVEDTTTNTAFGRAPEGYRAYLGVPLRTPTGEIIGTICSFQKHPCHFPPEAVSLAELFAERAATAIDNYHLYRQQQQFNHLLEAEVTKRTTQLHEAQAKLIERERLAAIGEFAAMIVHEIRNPLTTVQLGLNYFQKLDLPQPAQARLSLAMEEAERLANLLQEILSYSKPQILQLTEINIDGLIPELLVSWRSMPEAQNRIIAYCPPASPVHILGDSDKLKQVFINLIRNACEAVNPGDTITCYTTTNANQILISIHNGSEAIPPDQLAKLGTPFFTTKSSGNGLGLVIVRRIVEAHGGELIIQSESATGTTVSIQLPLIQTSS